MTTNEISETNSKLYYISISIFLIAYKQKYYRYTDFEPNILIV